MFRIDVLSAWKESPRFRHSRSVFPICAHTPCHCGDSNDDGANDCGVCFPIRWLCIPAACWRPDVLWITVRPVNDNRNARMASNNTNGTLSPAIVVCVCVECDDYHQARHAWKFHRLGTDGGTCQIYICLVLHHIFSRVSRVHYSSQTHYFCF